MSTTYSPNLGLGTPGAADRLYNLVIDPNWGIIDGLAALGPLSVITYEIPSSSLNVSVAAGTYRISNGSDVTYAGTTGLAVTASATTKVWLDEAGTVHTGSAYPTSGPYLPLASVTAGTTSVTDITDDRRYLQCVGGLPRNPVRTVTATTDTPTIADRTIRADATAAAIAIGLPTLTTTATGTPLKIMKVDASANAVTVTGVAGGTVTLSARYAFVVLEWDGSAWLKFSA